MHFPLLVISADPSDETIATLMRPFFDVRTVPPETPFPTEYLVFHDLEEQARATWERSCYRRWSGWFGRVLSLEEMMERADPEAGPADWLFRPSRGCSMVTPPVRDLYPRFEDSPAYLACLDADFDPDSKRRGAWINPNARWDHYTLGGSWLGMLVAKPGANSAVKGEADGLSPFEREEFERLKREVDADIQPAMAADPDQHPRGCDQVRVGEIDFEEMVKFHSQRGLRRWAALQEKLSGLDGPMLWHGVWVEPWAVPSEEEFLAVAGRPSTGAVLLGGQWYDVDEGTYWYTNRPRTLDEVPPDPREAWPHEWLSLVSNLHPDVTVTILDCHM